MRKRVVGPWPRVVKVIGAAAGTCVAAAVSAQANDVVADGAAMERVVVTSTAERAMSDLKPERASAGVLGDRSLLDTPFSMQVLSRSLIEAQQAATVQDLLKNDPSAVVSNVPVGFLTLRGFALGNDGVLYDGLPGHYGLTDARGVIDFVERVEVLKGAASFLHGMGTSPSLGGTVNYLPKPVSDERVRAGALSWTHRSLFGMSADIADRAGEQRQFGWRINVSGKAGEQATEGYEWNQRGVSLAGDWRLSPNAVVTLRHDDAHTELPRLQPFFAIAGATRVPDAPDASVNLAQPWDRFVVDYRNTYARLDWALSEDWQLSAQAMVNRHRRPDVLNARFGLLVDDAGTVMQFGSQSFWGVDTRSGSALLRGRLAALGARHELTVGATGGSDRTLSDVSDEAVNGGAPYLSNLYAPVYHDAPERINNRFVVTARARFSSLLVSDIVSFGERWSVLLGARHGRIRETSYDAATGVEGPRNDLSRTTPTAALMFKPSRQSLVYLNYAEGVERGGLAPTGGGITNSGQRMGPLVTRQLEAGAKLDWDGLALAMAVFDMRRPAEYLRTHDDGSATYVQDGEQRHRGLELTAAGRLARGWDLSTGLMVLDPTASGTGSGANDGKRPVGVPTATANVWLSHDVSAVRGLSLQGGVFHTSAQYADAANTLRVPAWTRVDLGARYEMRWGGTRYSVAASVENVADDSHWTGAQSGLLVLSDPRTYKLTLRAEL